MDDSPQIAIIGAGPYGLSIAAHLRERGVGFRIFGHPMQTWLTQMPRDMQLKSEGFASSLSSPGADFTLKQYCEEQNIPYSDYDSPVRLETFSRYGQAFQKRLVPGLEERTVISLARTAKGFTLQLDDGQLVHPRRVVVAVGIAAFSNLPPQLTRLPIALYSHSSRHRNLDSFRGRDVTIIGGGASALDLAALLHVEGATVRLICRQPVVEIHQGPGLKARTLWQRMRHPRSGIGHSFRSLALAEAPLVFHYLPTALRLHVVRTHLGPAGGWFIRDRVIGKIPLLLGSQVVQAECHEGRARLTIKSADGTESYVMTDHVIAATGYRIDLRRVSFLDQAIVATLHSVDHAPVLSSNFESSIAGLYFVGALSAASFGPLVRFAYGARFTAARISRHLSKYALRRIRARPHLLAQ